MGQPRFLKDPTDLATEIATQEEYFFIAMAGAQEAGESESWRVQGLCFQEAANHASILTALKAMR